MITRLDQLDPNGRYTYADYLTWRFDEYVELIRGKIYAMSAPVRRHQDVSSNIHGELYIHLWNTPCKLYSAPSDVRLVKKNPITDKDIKTVVQPDIFIVCDRAKLDRRGCIGAPDLVIEIVSPSTGKKDMNEKFGLYEEYGVREYWVVWPDNNVINVYLNNGTTLELSNIYEEKGRIPVGILPEIELDLEILFKD